MHPEDLPDKPKLKRPLRLKITTNKNLQFVTSIRAQSTISDLANRALNVYLELSQQFRETGLNKKQFTVSAVKQGTFFMPKSECVANLLKHNDEVQITIIKAKPKYPHHPVSHTQTTSFPFKNYDISTTTVISNPHQISKFITESLPIDQPVYQIKPISLAKDIFTQKINLEDSNRKLSKKAKKREKAQAKRQKEEQQKQQKCQLNQMKQFFFEKKTNPESESKIKMKNEKMDLIKTPDKLPIPSPKITFHSIEPKIDSPKPFVLNEPFRKSHPMAIAEIEKERKKDPENYQRKANIEKGVTSNVLPQVESNQKFWLQSKKSTDINRNKIGSKEKVGSKSQMIENEKKEKRQIEKHQIERTASESALKIKQVIKVEISEESEMEEDHKLQEMPQNVGKLKEFQEIEKKMKTFSFSSDEE